MRYAIAMNYDRLAQGLLSQWGAQTILSPWAYAAGAGVPVTFSWGRPLHALTSQGAVTLDGSVSVIEAGVALWRALATLELRKQFGREPVEREVEALALALALPSRACMALFAEVGCDGEALERAQPYAATEWIARRLETLGSGSRLRVVRSGAS